jgi:hypothetical protein
LPNESLSSLKINTATPFRVENNIILNRITTNFAVYNHRLLCTFFRIELDPDFFTTIGTGTLRLVVHGLTLQPISIF